MVESSVGSCRCACQDDFQAEASGGRGCCSPHIFTTVLLGILACVLMTGGVFLAFHRWDPMWLMVSGVGVVLVLIGAILHCCHNIAQQRARRTSAGGGKGVCPRPLPPDHPAHVVNNNGSLTEQLLPLSNARSVSQLSLNMLPGYFPPVVTAYGIEQHSAVVQNINRLVQQQQLQQQSQSTGSCSPGVASNAGKSFIVLSLPGDASAANIQNLVATVYQLDGSTNTQSNGSEANPSVAPPVTIIKPNSPIPLILKNAEVQTCNIWPTVASTSVASTSGENSVVYRTSDETDRQINPEMPVPSTSSGTTQTDDILPTSGSINLMDCSPDLPPICDTPEHTCDNQLEDRNSIEIIPPSSASDLFNVSELYGSASEITNSDVLVDIPQPPLENLDVPSAGLLVDVIVESSLNGISDQRNVLVDISVDTSSGLSGSGSNALNDLGCNCGNILDIESLAEPPSTSQAIGDCGSAELPDSGPVRVNPMLERLNADVLLSCSNFSRAGSDADESDLLERSSPPPSYEDVTLEGESVGAFSLAYGTI